MANYLRIKICGITKPAAGKEAASAGADAIGINFYSGSARFVNVQTAQTIVQELPAFVEAVGLFVNQPWFEVLETANQIGGLRTLQYHGAVEDMGQAFPYRLIPAFAIKDSDSLFNIMSYLERCGEKGALPAAVLVDAHVPGRYGGTGQRAPWALLAEFRPKVPMILAGGLTHENVAEAIRLVRPYGVDVSSGVETSPGEKNADKIRVFIDKAREAAAKY